MSQQADTAIRISWDRSGKFFELSCEVVLPGDRKHVFDFFSDAFQLERITPQWLNFEILTPAPIRICKGCLIDYRIKLHGIPVSWRTEISAWEPPFSFTDRQVRGPYRMWEHFHTFSEVPGGTLVRDRVQYQVPGGRLVNWLFVEKDLRKIFSFRCQELIRLFDAPSDSSSQASVAPLAESRSAL